MDDHLASIIQYSNQTNGQWQYMLISLFSPNLETKKIIKIPYFCCYFKGHTVMHIHKF